MRSPVLLFLIVLTPPLSQGLLSDHGDLLNTAASADGLTIAPAAIVAAVCLYTAWRLSAATSPSWIVAGLALFGVQSVSYAALQVSDPARTAQQHAWMTSANLVVVAAILVIRAYDGTRLLRYSPVALGAGLGAAIGLLRVVAVSRLVQLEPGVLGCSLIALAGVSMAAMLAWLILRGGVLPRWIRVRLVVAVLLLCAGHAVTALDGTVRGTFNVIAVLACSAVAATALVSATLGLLRLALSEHARRTSSLLEELAQVQEDHRHHRARMHEIESTIAGIRSAGELLQDPRRIAPERRRQLEEMIHSEVCRLERLLTSHQLPVRSDLLAAAAAVSATPPAMPASASSAEEPIGDEGNVDLDTTLATLATLHEAKGTAVRWTPSGHRAAARADDVTEVLNILLDNAARHGDGTAEVSVLDAEDTIEILVSDNGPGIAPEVRDRLFQWGARGPASPGQGIGLHIAQNLAERQGGYLRVQDPTVPAESGRGGATFVVGLPISRAARESVKENDGVLA